MQEDEPPCSAYRRVYAGVPLADRPLVVWEVWAGDRGASGVTRDPAEAEKAMLAVLDTMPGGQGRARFAWVTSPRQSYLYGTTPLTAHHADGVIVILAGDRRTPLI
ncbi:hypothetical protein [Spongiactinospora sp. TRM90649]|uniref:hypothetical protein n=1 Tax=Spongiactinospora sp. TRM90649 TaxID=3031114 RepID=UPI0023F901BF|nr:hypothetical protein [Spongiactinospora sp. TRM90649]MDF5756376.1 hypothetical protein [Spongiactinospora sp. TRM90649]